MKLKIRSSYVVEAALAVFVLCAVLLPAAHAKDTVASNQPAPVPSKAVPNNSSAKAPIPQSVFIIPSTTKEGRDPFFPNLTDRFATPTTAKPAKPSSKVGIDDLVLQGIAGHTDARLCVINGRTLAIGEEAGVPTSSGHVQIRCLEINETNVVIELGGERRELRFKPLK